MANQEQEDDPRLKNIYYSLNTVLKQTHPAMDEDQPSPVTAAQPMKLALPAIIQNSDRGLDAVPTSTLRKCLTPILEGLGALDAEDLLNLEIDPDGEGPCLREDATVRPIHNLVTPPCPEGTVRYIHLSEIDGQYSMGVFVFPPNSRIPLHDHPGMCVLSRVLYGDLRRESLDLARDENPDEESDDDDGDEEEESTSSIWLPWNKARMAIKRARRKSTVRPKGAKLAYRKRVDKLVAPGCTMLFPYEGNLHEFVAGPKGAAVLDVLLPPYDHDNHRDCTFYEIRECTNPEKHDTSRDPVWIVPTGQPEDFHCISGAYEKLDAGN